MSEHTKVTILSGCCRMLETYFFFKIIEIEHHKIEKKFFFFRIG